MFSRPRLTALVLALGVVLLPLGRASAADKKEERDIYDYAAQKAAKGVKKIVFVADTAPHGPRGNHEFLAAAIYLAKTINATYPDAYAVVYTKKHWPKDLKHADAVIVLLNHGGSAVNPAVEEATKRGAGFMAIHYGVEVNKGDQGKHYLQWLGGYFETFWSVNPWWTPEFKEIPKHPTTRGVKPFSIEDEWYYHMRFVKGRKGVTPVLSAVAPLSSLKQGKKEATPRGTNPAVRASVEAKEKQVLAWAYERPDGGRGFGFTGLHRHANLGNVNMRTMLLNAVAWVAKLKVPAGGVPSKSLDRSALEGLIDEGRLAVDRRGI
jgi:hypothetical protein